MTDPQQPQPEPQLGQPYSQPGQPYAQPDQSSVHQGQPRPGQASSHPGQPYAQPGQPYSQPGQPYSQPGQPYSQPGQPYAQPGQPYGSPAAGVPQGTTGPGARGNLGRTAFIVALLAVAADLFVLLITPFLYSSVGYDAVEVVSNLILVVVLIAAVAGLVLGLIALRRPAPHLLAAIAVGLAGSTVATVLVSWMSSLMYYIGF